MSINEELLALIFISLYCKLALLDEFRRVKTGQNFTDLAFSHLWIILESVEILTDDAVQQHWQLKFATSKFATRRCWDFSTHAFHQAKLKEEIMLVKKYDLNIHSPFILHKTYYSLPILVNCYWKLIFLTKYGEVTKIIPWDCNKSLYDNWLDIKLVYSQNCILFCDIIFQILIRILFALQKAALLFEVYVSIKT